MKVEAAVLGSPSLTVLMWSHKNKTITPPAEDIQQPQARIPSHTLRKATPKLNCKMVKAQELCESRRGRPSFPVPNSPYGLSVDVKQHSTDTKTKQLHHLLKTSNSPKLKFVCIHYVKHHRT